MQKEWKRPGIFSLWETKLLILIFASTTRAVIASRHVADDRIAQAAVLARQQEEEEALLEIQRAEEEETRRRESEAAESARIAAGPITEGANEDGLAVCRADYSLAAEEPEASGEGAADYSQVLDPTAYCAYVWRSGFGICYAGQLYGQTAVEDKGTAMEDWNVLTISSPDAGRLIAEHRSLETRDRELILSKMCEWAGQNYGVNPRELGREETEDGIRMFWSDDSGGTLARGVIRVKGSAADMLIVSCPGAVDEQDGQYKEFYLESVLNLCTLSGKGMETPTWEAWKEQGAE